MAQNRREKMKNSKKVADRMYDASDYHRNDEVSEGMATTHEQVSDVYMEGTIEREKED